MIRSFLPFWGLLKRELIRDLRRPRPIILLGGVLAVATFVILAGYPGERVSGYPGGQVSPMQMRNQSMMILGGLTATLLGAAVLLLPGYAATAIVVERESDTYDLLSLTLTRPMVIVLGKLASSLGYFLLVIVGTMPLIGTTMFLVGVDTSSIAGSAVYLAIIAVTCASMGIMSSAVVRNTPRAVLVAYFTTFIALGGFVIPFALFRAFIEIVQLRELEPVATSVLLFAASLSPFGAAGVVIGGPVFASSLTVLRLMLGQGAFSLLALLIARRMLTRPNEERSFTSFATPPPLPTMPGAPARSRMPFAGTLPPWPPVPDNANPIRARELLQVRITQRLTPLRLALVFVCIVPIILILAFALFEANPRVSESDAVNAVHAWMIGLAILMAFVAPGSSAAAWTREYERETMDLLRTSLMTPRQLVYGKVIAALCACVYPFVIAIVASLPLIRYPFLSPLAFIHLLAGLVTIGITTFLCVAVASLMGLFTRRTTAAVLYGYAGSMAVLCSPFLMSAAIVLITMFDTPEEFFTPWWHLSPITVYAFHFQPDEPISTINYIVWVTCTIAQFWFAWFLVRMSVRLLTARHLQDR